MIDSNLSKLEKSIHMLLLEVGILGDISELRSIGSGGNNKIWLIKSIHKHYVVKQYFQHPDDLRNRLKADFEFSKYVHQMCPGMVPEPIAVNFDESLAIYEYVQGLPLLGKKVSLSEINEAANFFKLINPPARFKAGFFLGNASESCFSIGNHLSSIESRVNNLLSYQGNNKHDSRLDFFLIELRKYWDALKVKVEDQLTSMHLSIEDVIPREQYCISPSDFGFHNAILNAEGKIIFLDFEYAGWDDPAKMVGDFFAQLAVPIPLQYFENFCQLAFSGFFEAELIVERAKLLLPVYQVKWCCIALNVVSPVNMARRKFANPNIDERQLIINQLTKAEGILKKLKKDKWYGLH
jgi:hypothetical protein